MKKRNVIRQIWVGLITFLTLTLVHAETQPKFTIIPTTPTRLIVGNNNVATVQYNVTNKTFITRKLTMVPIEGVTPVTTGAGYCSNPFTLAHDQSCLLTLLLTGNQLPRHITSGPVVCKTNRLDDNPDPFLCSQPSQANSLNVLRLDRARLRATPRNLVLTAGGGIGVITVTNLSSVVIAENIHAVFGNSALNGNVTAIPDSSCSSVAPGQSCNITFIAGVNSVSKTPFIIIGDNTFPTIATIQIVSPTTADITVSPPQLVMNVGGPSVVLTVTNHSTVLTANNVKADLSNSPGVTQSPSGGCTAPISGTCTLTFSPGTTVIPATPPNIAIVKGDNTSQTSVQIIVNPAPTTTIVISAPSPNTMNSPLALLADGQTTGTMTIQNTGAGPATNVSPHLSPNLVEVSFTTGSCSSSASSCNPAANPPACSIAAGDTCNFIFTPGTTIEPSSEVNFFGSNTNTATGYISVGGNIVLTTGYSGSTYFMDRCFVNICTNSLYGCARLGNPNGTLNLPNGIVISPPSAINTSGNTYVYIANYSNNNIVKCILNTGNGTVGSCGVAASNITQAVGLAINPVYGYLYATYNSRTQNQGKITQCTITPGNGNLSCGNASPTLDYPSGLTVNPAGNILYVTLVDASNTNSFSKCTLSTGTVSSCTSSSQAQLGAGTIPWNIVVNSANTFATVANSLASTTSNAFYQCQITSGNLSSCIATASSGITYPSGLIFNTANTYAYVGGAFGIYWCPIVSNVVSSCQTNFSDPTQEGIGIWEDSEASCT